MEGGLGREEGECSEHVQMFKECSRCSKCSKCFEKGHKVPQKCHKMSDNVFLSEQNSTPSVGRCLSCQKYVYLEWGNQPDH